MRKQLFIAATLAIAYGILYFTSLQSVLKRDHLNRYQRLTSQDKELVDRYEASVRKIQPGDLVTDDTGTTYIVENYQSTGRWRMKAKDGTIKYLSEAFESAHKNRTCSFTHRSDPHYVQAVHTFKLE